MEEIYFKNEKSCRIRRTSSLTDENILNFSKSFQVINYEKFQFENNLN